MSVGQTQPHAISSSTQRPPVTLNDVMDRLGIILVLVVLIAGIAIYEKVVQGNAYFFSLDNFGNIMRQVPWQAPLALGEFLTILTAGIDLSVGSIMSFGMVSLVLAVHNGWPVWAAIVLALGVGTACGLVNGLALTRLHLPHPFIPTLAMLNIARGLTNLISNGVPILHTPWWVRLIGAGNFCVGDPSCGPSAFRIPISFVIVVAIFVLMGLFLTRTQTGRHIYAIGGNPRAALYSGINVGRNLTLVYTLCGLLCAVGAIILAGRTDSGEPQAGVGAELNAIAAVIIGGASFFGGRGTVTGVFVGILIMAVIGNGLNILGVTPFLQQVAIGLIILIVTTVDVVRRRTSRAYQD